MYIFLGSFPVTLSKRVGSLLGGDCLTVSGISVEQDDKITCTFEDTVVEGFYIDDKKIICVTPPQKEESVVKLRINVTRGHQAFTKEALYQYSEGIIIEASDPHTNYAN